MKYLKSHLCFALIALVLLASCKKNEDSGDDNISGNNGSISAKYLLQVTDENGNAIPDALVQLSDLEEYTDADGLALFISSDFNGAETPLQVVREGYFTYQGTVYIQQGEHQWKVVLRQGVLAGTFMSNNSYTLNLPGNASINFSPNSIGLDGGGVYNGQVSVYASYIAPESPMADALMPNSFLGKDSQGNSVFLENHGALLVELRGSANELLQLSSGATAALTLPVADVDLGSPQAELPLYYFDTSTGKWKEDGAVNLVGQSYQGNVSHFTWWMCPYVYDHYSLSSYLMCGEYPLANAEVSIYNQWGAYLGSVQSGSNGYFYGMIPEELTFDLVVFDPCDNQAYSQQIGPFNSNTQLPDIAVCSGDAVYSIISASITDCEGNPSGTAYCRVVSNDVQQLIPANNQGLCENAVLFCNNSESCVISGWNPQNGEVSPDQNFNISAEINVGTLQLCETQDEFVTFTLDGIDYYFTPNEFNLFGSTYSEENDRIGINVLGGEFLNETQFMLLIEGSVPGQYSVGGSGFDYSFVLSGNNGDDYLTVILSQSGTEIGSIISGSVEDTQFHDVGGNLRTLENCSFRFTLQTIL